MTNSMVSQKIPERGIYKLSTIVRLPNTNLLFDTGCESFCENSGMLDTHHFF